MFSLGKRVILLVSILLLAACKQQFTIESPTNNFINNDQPDIFRVAYPDGQPSGLSMQLNTANVTSFFTLGETEATATGDSLAEHIFPGRNVFRVKAGSKSEQVYFWYDIEGPTIHILEASHEDGTVSGYLADRGGVVSLSIDGSPVALNEDNSFATNFTSMPVNLFTAVDGFGNQSETKFARNDQEFHPAMSARLNAGGVSFLGDALAAALGNIDFEAFLNDINPLVDLNFIGFFTVAVELRDFSFDEPIIDLEVRDDERLDTHVDIPNFSIGMEMGGKTLFLIPWSVGGTITMDNLVLDTNVLLDIVDKDLDVDLNGTAIEFENFHLDLDYIPNILGFENLLSAIIEAIVEALSPLFMGILESVILPVVSDFIGEIPIEIDITTADNETLRVKALPDYLDTFDNGLTIDLGATITAPYPAAEARPTLGHIFSEGSTPTIGNTTPDGEPFDIGASISANLINQALLAAHESGITTMTIRPDNTPGTDPEGVSVIQNDGDPIQTSDLIGMRLVPASPPFIKLLDREGTWGVLGWYDVKLAFDLKRVGWEDYQTLFVTTFNLEVPFELGATDDGFLQIGIEQLPTIEIIKSDEQGSLVLSPIFINGILDHFMPVILPKIAAELKAVPLPRIAGHSIHPEAFWVSGEGKNNLSLAGSLVKLSTTQQAEAPDTILDFANSASITAVPASTQSTELTVINGTVNIGISGDNPTNEPLEFRFRVDNGPWSVWKPRSHIQLQRLLGGEHTVEVCARTVLLKQEIDCPKVQFTTAVN